MSTSPPLSSERRRALGELLTSVSLGRLLHPSWRSDLPVPELTFGQREVGRAIEYGVTPDVLERLLEISGTNPQFTSSYNGSNLARLAAIHGKPDLLRVLIELRSDPSVGSRSVLDELALVMPEQDDGSYSDVVEQLVDAGDRPYLPTLERLRRVMPMVALPSLHPEAVALLEDPKARRLAGQFRELLDTWNARIEEARDIEKRCEPVAVRSESLSTLTAKQIFQSKLEADRANDPALDEARALLALAEETIQSGEAPEHVVAFGRMLDLWETGLWTDALALSEEWNLGFDSLVRRTLLRGAPFEVAIDLIQRNGGKLPEESIILLTSNPWPGGARLADRLVDVYGIDVRYVDEDGRNAFDHVSEHIHDPFDLTGNGVNTDAREIAQFLAERGVPVTRQSKGLDPLDNVLLRAIERPRSLLAVAEFARFLIEHGAPVEPSHRELAAWLAEVNPSGYEWLVDLIPQLERT